MVQRYEQLTNPNENQDQLYIQQLLSNLSGESGQQELLKYLNQTDEADEKSLALLEQKLNQMGFDAEELKKSEPQFFNMIRLCYQVNMAKLQQQVGPESASEEQQVQMAEEVLNATIN